MPKEGDDEYLLNESDDDDEDLPSDFSANVASEDEVFDYDSASEKETETAQASESEQEEDSVKEDENGNDSDALSLAEDSDNEDLIPLGEIPDGLIAYDGSDNEEWGGIDSEEPRKRKRSAETKGKEKKRLRSLPTFASYEEYAKMIEDGPEDDI